MATFPSIQPTYGTRKQSNPKFKTTQMGDGYEFRTLSYSQSGGTTVTITIANHGLAINDVVTIDYTSGTAADGTFTVATAADQNTFTVTSSSSTTASGNVTVTFSGAGKFVCEQWSKTIPYANRATLRCTFREVFEP